MLDVVLQTSKASLDIMTNLVDDKRANTLELNTTEAEEDQSAGIFNLLIQ
jgi:hypothetical protein